MKLALCTAAAAVLFASVPALAASKHEAAFLKEAMEGDNSETTLGSIAAQRGGSNGVRRFGRMLATDHRKGKAEASAVARRLHVPVTNRMANEAIAERSKLRHLRGSGFDREFARYMVKDHKSDIAKFSKEASSRDNAEVVALARKTLPVLRKHLRTAESLER